MKMVIPSPSVDHRDVIFVVDSSACLSGLLPFLLKEYIQPCVEYFSGGKLPEVSYGMQNAPAQYGLVTVNPSSVTYRPVCTYYPITSNPITLLKWISDLRLEGGLVGHSLPLSEGVAAAMELGQLMQTTRQSCMSPDVTVEKHCVLVLNQPFSQQPCVESLKYAGKTAPQIIKLLVENGTNLSLISPRCLADLRHLIQKTLPISPTEMEASSLDELDHALHSNHLVLLQGFQLTAIKERKKALLEEKVNSMEAKGAATDFSMDTTAASIKKEEHSPSDVPVKVEIRSGSPLTLSTTAPAIKQEPSVETTYSAPSPFTLPTSQPVKIAVAGQASAQVLPTSRAAGSSSHNPIQIISPNVPDKSFMLQSSNESETVSMQSAVKTEPQSTFTTPLATSTQGGAPMIRTMSGGVPSVGTSSTGANLEMARKAAQQAIMQAQQVSSQPGNTTVPQPVPGSVPSTQTTVPMSQPHNLASLGGVGQPGRGGLSQPAQAQVSQAPTTFTGLKGPTASVTGDMHRVPTPPILTAPQATPSSMAPAPGQVQQGFPPQGNMQVQQAPRPITIWNGIMEVADMVDNQRQMRQIQCSVTALKNDVIQEVQPKTWPQKMTMSAYPKAMFNSIMTGMDFSNKGATANLKTVAFQFQESLKQSVSVLRQLMSAEGSNKMFAIVHLVGANTACPIKAMILVFNQKQFTGLIPLEQDKFVSVVKQVLINRQAQRQYQQLQQQQQQQQQQQLQNASGTSFQQSGAQVQNYSQPSSSYTQPANMQYTMSQAQGSIIGQPSGVMSQRGGILGQGQQPQQGFNQSGGMMAQQQTQPGNSGMMAQQQTQPGNSGMMAQQQTQPGNSGMMAQQQTQPGNSGMMAQQQTQPGNSGMMAQQQTQPGNSGMMAQQQTQPGNSGMMAQQQTQPAQNMMSQQQGMLAQQQQNKGVLGQQQGQGMVQQQGQGMVQQQGQGMVQQQGQGMVQQQGQGMVQQQGQNVQQAHLAQQQSVVGMMSQQGQGLSQQQQGQTMLNQQAQTGVMKTGGQGMVGQQVTSQQQQASGFGQGGMTPQQQQQEKVKKFLTALINSLPERREAIFQHMGIVNPEIKQQWLQKAGAYKQQLMQSRMQMMGGNTQQGVQQQMPMGPGHNMQSQMNQGYNRPGVQGQNMGGIRPSSNQMAPQQQQQHMPPGYNNQWQGQR